MNPMLKLFFLYSLLLGAAGCKPEEPIPPDPDPNPKDTVALAYNRVWEQAIPGKATGALVNDKIWYHQGNPIISTQDNQGNSLIVCFDRTTGSVKWQWAEIYGDCVGGGDFILTGDYVVANINWKNVVVIDAYTGLTVWKTTIKNNSVPRITAFDGYVYYSHERSSGSTAYFVRSPLSHLAWDTLAVIGAVEGAKPMLEPANRWLSPSGDTLVLFSNRTGRQFPNGGVENYIALYAYSLQQRKIVWTKEDFCEDNTSSVRAPYLYHNKLYFMGLGDLTCMNPETGDILWQRSVNEDPNVGESFSFTDLVFWDNKMAFAPGNVVLHCWDVNTGKTIWKNTKAGQAREMTAYDGKIWYASGDDVYNFSDGQQAYPNHGIYAGSIAVDTLSGRVCGFSVPYVRCYEKKP